MNIHPIADMLTRIRNASARQAQAVKIPTSRFKETVAQLLVETGWVEKAEVVKPADEIPYLLVSLKYYREHPVIRGIRMISKSGQRIYKGKAQLAKSPSSKLETVVVSTSQGLMTGAEARAAGLGGEVLFKIW